MIKRILKLILPFLFFFIIIAGTESKAQSLPDYKERAFPFLADSLLQQSMLPSVTEGSIDENEYIVGPGDNIFISISGIRETVFNLVINHEGMLYIPKVGGVDLRNNSLARAKEKIYDALNRYYKNVDLFVSLSDIRKIKVSLLGDVNIPATHILSANSRLLDVITRPAGLTPTSNFRNILIVSRDGKEQHFDLLKFLRFGDLANNPFLKEGDRVIVDKIDKTVSIMGTVKFQGTYEFVEGETAKQLIDLAGGFLQTAKTDTIELIRFCEMGKVQKSYYYSLNQIINEDILLQAQDRILVKEIPDYLVDRFIKIEGYVYFPGWYKIVKGKTTLSSIIEEAGGFREEASLIDAKVFSTEGDKAEDPEFERLKLMLRADMTDDEYDYFKARSRQRVGRVVVDFVRLFEIGDKSEDIILRKGDLIEIPEVKNYITLLGQVLNPGKVIFKENYSIKDYIELAGGFGWRALERDVRVIKGNTGEWIDADDVDRLEPGDTIWIPEDPPGPKFWEVFTTALQIVGQVASIVAVTVAIIVASR